MKLQADIGKDLRTVTAIIDSRVSAVERSLEPSCRGQAVPGVAEPPCGSAQRDNPVGVDGAASGEDACATGSYAAEDANCADLPTAPGIIKVGVSHGGTAGSSPNY